MSYGGCRIVAIALGREPSRRGFESRQLPDAGSGYSESPEPALHLPVRAGQPPLRAIKDKRLVTSGEALLTEYNGHMRLKLNGQAPGCLPVIRGFDSLHSRKS